MISFVEKKSDLEWRIHWERRIEGQDEGFRCFSKELVVIPVIMGFEAPGNS